ncbi:hypothetical protein ACLOJK_004105 [Asimina triloba]
MAAEPIIADEHNTVRPDLGTTPVHPSAIDEHHDHAHDPTDQPCLSPITPPSMRHQTAMAAHSISSLIDTSACITSLVPKPPRLHWWTTIHQDPAFVPATIAPASAPQAASLHPSPSCHRPAAGTLPSATAAAVVSTISLFFSKTHHAHHVGHFPCHHRP